LLVALEKRNAAYTVLDNRFGVLTQSRGMTDAEVRLGLRTLIASYPNDVEPGLEDEFIQFRHFVEKENVDPLLTCTNCSNQETWYRRFQMLTLFLEYTYPYLLQVQHVNDRFPY
jgi:hypothetical protein